MVGPGPVDPLTYLVKSTFIVTTHFSNFNMSRRIHVYQIKLGILNHFKPKGQQKKPLTMNILILCSLHYSRTL